MSTQRGQGQLSSTGSTSEGTLPHEYDDTENHSKQGYLALQKAFHDMSKKYQFAQEEKLILQAQNTALQKESENLKQTVEKSFKAFDDKYKETEKLKKELKTKQKPNKMNQNNPNKSTGLERKHQEMKELHATQVVKKTTSSTQTMEAMSDGIALTLSNYKSLLEDCGLKIVSQDDRKKLVLTNLSSFKLWVKNSTGGKVRIDFQKTPVNERSVQTDEFVEQRSDRKSYDQEAMINMLKSKITDQANVIKAQRQLLTKMRETQLALTAKKEIQNESHQYHILKRYHQTFLHYSQEAANQVKRLKIQLENQSEYTKRLLVVVMGSKDLPKQLWWLSELRRKTKCHEEKEINEASSFPVSEEHIEDDAEENLTSEDEFEYCANGGLYSIAVQETDESLAPAGNGSSASVVTLLTSSSSSSDSKFDLQTSRARGSIDPNKSNPCGIRKDINPNITTENDNGNRGAADTGSDDFVVLNEQPVASGGALGVSVRAKQCPVCFLSFTSTYDQEAFEEHVVAHFQE